MEDEPMKERILKLLAKSEPLKTGDIAKVLKLDSKEVTKVIKALKKEEKIISPKRCFYTVEKAEEKLIVSKKDFVSLYKEKGTFKTKVEAETNLNAFMDLVGELLTSGKEVNFTGWGKFKIVQREERKGRNPQTGEEITISAKKLIKFKSGKKLDEKVNN
jgi:DNA-binding protein HU-beta